MLSSSNAGKTRSPYHTNMKRFIDILLALERWRGYRTKYACISVCVHGGWVLRGYVSKMKKCPLSYVCDCSRFSPTSVCVLLLNYIVCWKQWNNKEKVTFFCSTLSGKENDLRSWSWGESFLRCIIRFNIWRTWIDAQHYLYTYIKVWKMCEVSQCKCRCRSFLFKASLTTINEG